MYADNADINKWIICRICLKCNDKQMSHLFGAQAPVDSFKEKIEECGGVTLSENNNLPDKICDKCLLLFRAAHKFRMRCKRSQKQLNDFLLNKSKSDGGTEEVVSILQSNDFEMYAEPVEEKHTQFLKQQAAQESTQDNGEYEELGEFLPEGENSEDGIIDVNEEYVNIPTDFLEDESNQDDPYKITYCTRTYEVIKDDNSQDSGTEIETISYEVQMQIEQLDEDRNDIAVYEVKRSSQPVSTTKPDTDTSKSIKKRKRNVKANKNNMNVKVEQGNDEEMAGVSKVKMSTYVCSYCGNTYNEKAKLTLHMKIHTKEKPHECEICHKRFAQTPQLARHMNSHTGSRPFKCKFCNSSFADPSTCIKHERIHTNERPYTCEICKKSFSYSNVLKVHIMTHTGEKPFQCEYCGKKFAQLHHKRTHERTHNYILKLGDDSTDDI